ncbi:ABC transporter substrate-binding protein [Phytoactinopolyspora alkaliphila]|uniref:ABC transporter substrate-binding protein n=1 Tax=Phytoactinopolyspora alkaliphila TaxID=1783498 RepID=A0A6N9YIE2_9ACTN|nr:ABC transporter substrate-binding protein [Phytoactinopolyspora alkaliphila]NED94763.1 ABC transporter substrate-binding protein [Phytoactinopolyspora alkaliphila]
MTPAQSRHDDGFAAAWSDALSRRQLLRAAGLGAVALGGLAAGCTAEAPAPDDAGGSESPAASTGELSAAMANIFSDLDPTTASAVGTIALNRFIYEALYRVDPFPPRTELTPELATDLPQEIDPTTYRIPLRDDAVFHDGNPLTAEDIVYTIQRIQDPDVGSLFARYFEIIESVEAIGEHEIEIRLNAPTTLLAQRLILVRGMSKAAVDASSDALTVKPVGTGPYQVDAVVSGQEVTLNLYDGYTGSGKYNFQTVNVDVTADGNARTAGLRSGQTRIIEDVPGSSFAGLSTTDGLQAEGARGDHLTGLMFHCGIEPFNDVRVRQAVMFAIDRDAITQTSFFGHAEATWEGEISADDPDYAKPSLIYRYDPDHARQLLADAGYGDGGIKVDFLAANLEYLASQTPIIEENLRDVGFEPNVVPGELESLYSRVAEGSYNLFLMKGDTAALGATDAEFLLRWIYYGALPRQFMYWDVPARDRVEELLDEALTSADTGERAAALAEVQDIIQTEVPLGRLHRADYLTGWSSTLQNFRALPTSGFALDGVTG